MPTWRRQLAGERSRERHSRLAVCRQLARATPIRATAELAERAGLRVAFVPHPRSVDLLATALPDHVQTYRYSDVDIQELFARGAGLITDYSSNAFELAYLNRPVIYFQFDRQDFFSGQHVYRRGEWSYECDGFGPVVEQAADVLDELATLIDRDFEPGHPYAERMAQAFAFRDGKCCERVFESILAMRRPPALATAGRPGRD